MKISGLLCFSGQAGVTQKSWMIKCISIQWKIAGQLCFSGQARVAQKSWVIKCISIQWKIPEQTLFLRASASCSKILNDKIYFNTVKNSRANSVSQGKRKLFKKSECKKYIPYSEIFQGKLCFSGQALVAQKSWMIKYISITVKNPRATLFFRTSASYSKLLYDKKYIFNTVKISGQTLVFRASASCSKFLNDKIYLNTVKNSRANTVFQGKRKLLKKSECKKYIPYSKKFQGISVSQGKS